MSTLTLRHTLATLAYRAGKAVRDMPVELANFSAGENARTPGQILAHMGDLMDWALSIVNGKQAWHNSEPLPWPQEVERFFAALERFDARLTEAPVGDDATVNRLFQGPVADALTHTGQIAILRRMAGAPVKGENYFVAKIAEGQIQPATHTAPVREF